MMYTERISLECQIVQSEENIVSDMDGEKVMLNVQKGKYYNLGETGGEIWEIMKTPIMVTELVNIMLSKYNIERKDCEEQVLSFLECLFQEGLIQIEDQSNR
ncbi:lasso peptide biosynthesis PqqD family chaperone [Bacillus luti]|uniref:lasso peptide biosynthesis PqqD family chaperone n=1 Tax=Bacillus luti TaxID=2026191 RepID=UPI003CFCBEC6